MGILVIGGISCYYFMFHHKIELVTCLNDLKDSITTESDILVQLTACQTETKARENFELKAFNSECNERILKLEKDNVTCHTEKQSLKEKIAKCEEDRVPCNERLRNVRKFELDKCLNDFKRLEEKESDTLLKLTECQTEAQENIDNKIIQKLKAEKKKLNEKFTKCEELMQKCEDKKKNH